MLLVWLSYTARRTAESGLQYGAERNIYPRPRYIGDYYE